MFHFLILIEGLREYPPTAMLSRAAVEV